MNKSKAYVDKGGVIRFDGIGWLEPPVDELLAIAPLEATAQGKITLLSHESTAALLHQRDENGAPVEITFKVVAYRTPMTAQERLLCDKRTSDALIRKDKKTEDEQRKQGFVFNAIAQTAVQTARSMQETVKTDPVTLAIQQAQAAVAQRIAGALSAPALTSGQ